MNKGKVIALLFVSLAILITALFLGDVMNTNKKYLDELVARVGAVKEFPDPAYIRFTGEWYLLDHVSEGLIGYDADDGKFVSLIADSFQSNGTTHKFLIKDDAKFSDGSKITMDDIVATFKYLRSARVVGSDVSEQYTSRKYGTRSRHR